MKIRARSLILSLIFIITTSTIFTSSAGAFALALPAGTFGMSPAANEACQGVSNTGCNNGLQVSTTLGTLINVFTAIIGLIAVIMIMIAGLQFMTANGNAQNIAKARSALIYAIIGLIIVVLAQLVVHFVINQAASAG